MSATVYGDITWGMAAENGLYAQSVDVDYGVGEFFVSGEDGDDEGGATFNESATFSLSGFEKTSGTAMSSILGAAFTLANAFDHTDFISGYVSGGVTLLTSAKPSRKNREAKAIDLGGVFKPWLGAVQS